MVRQMSQCIEFAIVRHPIVIIISVASHTIYIIILYTHKHTYSVCAESRCYAFVYRICVVSISIVFDHIPSYTIYNIHTVNMTPHKATDTNVAFTTTVSLTLWCSWWYAVDVNSRCTRICDRATFYVSIVLNENREKNLDVCRWICNFIRFIFGFFLWNSGNSE